MTQPFNLRTTENPVIRRAGRSLARMNARHPWDHNAHFHGWILRSLPARPQRALDVGCGRGGLVAALRGKVPEVHGIDPDEQMAREASDRFAAIPRVEIRRQSFADVDPADGGYDVITMVASLHHMDLEEALEKVRSLMRPSGRLLVATLVDPRGRVDTAWEIANALSNPVIGMVKHPRPAPPQDGPPPYLPVKDPPWSTTELRRRTERILPGTVLRRREGFRSTLLWEAPAG